MSDRPRSSSRVERANDPFNDDLLLSQSHPLTMFTTTLLIRVVSAELRNCLGSLHMSCGHDTYTHPDVIAPLIYTSSSAS